jgi:hypothetical protein
MQAANAKPGTTDLGARIEAARAAAVKLTIYHLPPGLRTLLAIAAGAIEEFPGVAVDEISDAATIAAALDALAAARPSPADGQLNARYGLIFTDAAGERILRAYKSRFPSEGQIDETPCDYEEPAFHEWLVARYQPARRNAQAEIAPDEE